MNDVAQRPIGAKKPTMAASKPASGDVEKLFNQIQADGRPRAKGARSKATPPAPEARRAPRLDALDSSVIEGGINRVLRSLCRRLEGAPASSPASLAGLVLSALVLLLER